MLHPFTAARFTAAVVGSLLVLNVAACSATQPPSNASAASAPSNLPTVAIVAQAPTVVATVSTPAQAPTAVATGAATGAATNGLPAKLNLNTATAADFRTIPGVGDRMVREFMEYRPYASIQQFRREIGKYVDARQVAEYEKYVFVPIAINDSDAATLQQIPGLDAASAATVVAGRPYASSDAFIAALATRLTPDQLAVARTYVSTP